MIFTGAFAARSGNSVMVAAVADGFPVGYPAKPGSRVLSGISALAWLPGTGAVEARFLWLLPWFPASSSSPISVGSRRFVSVRKASAPEAAALWDNPEG